MKIPFVCSVVLRCHRAINIIRSMQRSSAIQKVSVVTRELYYFFYVLLQNICWKTTLTCCIGATFSDFQQRSIDFQLPHDDDTHTKMLLNRNIS